MTAIANDPIKLAAGHHRVCKVHMQYAHVPDEPCVACGGTGKDPDNRRRKRRACYYTPGRLKPAENYRLRHGYGNWTRDLAGCRDVADAFEVVGGQGPNPPFDVGKPALIYYLNDPDFPARP